MKPTIFIPGLLLSLFLISACTHSSRHWRKNGIIPQRDTTITIGTGSNTLTILYTGCGGMAIKHGNEILLTDPYYTSHRLREKKIQPDLTMADIVFDSIQTKIGDTNTIKTVLVSHSHYDHLEDLPELLTRNKLAPTTTLIASTSAICTVRNFTNNNNNIINADNIQYYQGTDRSTAANWITANTFSIMPIYALHAPHYYGVHQMSGQTNCNNFTSYDTATEKTRKKNWREGSSYAFLVDLLDKNGKAGPRIYIMTSACAPPNGFPPPADINERPIDLAIICVASYSYVADYPYSLLNTIKPKKTILVHWEDFLNKGMYVQNPRVVALTRIKPFMKRVKRYYGGKIDDLDNFVVMPKPLTAVTVTY